MLNHPLRIGLEEAIRFGPAEHKMASGDLEPEGLGDTRKSAWSFCVRENPWRHSCGTFLVGGMPCFVTAVRQPMLFLRIPMQGFIDQRFASGDDTTFGDTLVEQVFLQNSCKSTSRRSHHHGCAKNNRASGGHRHLSRISCPKAPRWRPSSSDVVLTCSSWKRYSLNALNAALKVFSFRAAGAGSKLRAGHAVLRCGRRCSGSFETGHSKTEDSISTEVCQWRDNALEPSDPLSDTRAPYSTQHHQTQHQPQTNSPCNLALSVAKRTENADTRGKRCLRVKRILGVVVVVCDVVLEVGFPVRPVDIALVMGLLQGPILSNLYMELGLADATATEALARAAVGSLHRRAVRRWLEQEIFAKSSPPQNTHTIIDHTTSHNFVHRSVRRPKNVSVHETIHGRICGHRNRYGPQVGQRAWTLSLKATQTRSIGHTFWAGFVLRARYPGPPGLPRTTRNPRRTTQDHENQTQDYREHYNVKPTYTETNPHDCRCTWTTTLCALAGTSPTSRQLHQSICH